MVKVENFHEALERDLARLTDTIREQRRSPDVKAVPEREVVRRSLESFTNSVAPAPAPPPSKTDGHVSDSILPGYLQGNGAGSPAKVEVEALIDLVFHKGLERAVQEAKRHSPYAMDAFHDALVDKLLPILKQRGIL